MMGLDGGVEPSKNDMNRMDDISSELDQFGQELDVKMFKTAEH